MWLAIWILLTAFVLGVSLWSWVILRQQKKAWSAFAVKTGLNYTPGTLMGSPTVTGLVKGRKLSFFTAAQKTNDARGQRYVTVIELEMGSGLPVGAALATKEFSDFLSTLRMDETLELQSPDWDKSYIVKTRNAARLKEYLTPERLKIIHALFSAKNSIALFIFDETDSVIRIETSDPLRKMEQLESLAKKLTAAADKLAPQRGQPEENQKA